MTAYGMPRAGTGIVPSWYASQKTVETTSAIACKRLKWNCWPECQEEKNIMPKKPPENCEHGFICTSCVQCRNASFYRWNGKPTRHRTVITISIEVVTCKEDSLEVLADALAGDAINALLGVHKIPACRIRQILYYSPIKHSPSRNPKIRPRDAKAQLAPKERK
jgi:hypothetical protein